MSSSHSSGMEVDDKSVAWRESERRAGLGNGPPGLLLVLLVLLRL